MNSEALLEALDTWDDGNDDAALAWLSSAGWVRNAHSVEMGALRVASCKRLSYISTNISSCI